MHDHGASAQYNNQQSTSDRLTRIECTVDAIASTLTEHVEIQKQDKNVDQLLIAELKVRLARLESIHEKEDAVKAAMAKWVKWFYGVGAAILGVLFSEAMRRLPLRIAIFASSALLASVVSYAVNAATYYVATNGSNANAGSSEAPWQTIAFAATKVIAGDTVIVKSGTYATSLRTTLSGTANARIRYVSEPRGGAVIVPPPNNSSDTAWEQVGDYVTIDGFTINGSAHQSGTRWRTGIKASGAYNTVQGVTIRNIGNLEPNVASYGVWGTSGATNVEILASAVFDIGAAGTTDTSAPSQPKNVVARVVSSSQIDLTWSASTDTVGVVGYRIYRCTGNSCTPGTTVHATSSGTSYSDTGLSASTIYGYKVVAYDASGNESQASSVAYQTTTSSGGDAANVDGLTPSLIAFNQPSRETLQSSPKKVFAHWHQYPISRNKEGPTGDWYSAFSRVRTLPLRRPARTSSGDTEWRIEDALFDIQQARRIGVDAFFVNMYREDQTNPWAWPMWDYMLKAASRDNKGFKVAPNFDCSGGGDASQGTTLANMASNWLDAIGEKNSANHMKVGNKFVVGTYWVNNCQPQHYSNFKSRMSELGMPVFLVCVMIGPYNSAYDSVCDAWSNWGERGADAAVNLNYTSPSEFGTKAGVEPIMAAISVGDVRYPVGDTHWADEQKGFGTLANTWGEAIGLTDWAQLVTWNDIGEHSHFYPGTGMGYSQYDLTAFYIAWFKTGVMPAINKDAIYYSHRIANVPSGSGMPNLRSGSWANNVYAVFMLTDTATVQIITASGTTQQQLAAGVHTISAPMPSSGRPRFKIIRNSQTVVDVTSSYNIAAMPTPNDVVYRGGGSLRTIYGQINSASTVCASGTADQCLNVNSEPVWLAK